MLMASENGRLHSRLSRQRALLGLLQLRPNPMLIDLASQCGYDFLFLDGEHGVFSDADFCETLKALTATDVLGLVRLPGHDREVLRRYLDMGADAIIVPHVSTAEEASALVRQVDSQTTAALIVILESRMGASNAEAILALACVAGAFVGPNDLTADLGFKGDYAQPAYEDALSRIERAAAATGKFLGTAPHGGYSLQALWARGHRLFVLGSDRSLIRDAMNLQMTRARQALNQVTHAR